MVSTFFPKGNLQWFPRSFFPQLKSLQIPLGKLKPSESSRNRFFLKEICDDSAVFPKGNLRWFQRFFLKGISMANPAFRIHFLEWFQEFFLKEICDEFKGFSSGLWQTSFQKLRISGRKLRWLILKSRNVRSLKFAISERMFATIPRTNLWNHRKFPSGKILEPIRGNQCDKLAGNTKKHRWNRQKAVEIGFS